MSLAAYPQVARFLRPPRGLSRAVPDLLGPEVVLVALADRLFWGHAAGLSLSLSLPLFCAAVALAAAWLRPGRRSLARAAVAALLLLAALAPAVVRPTALSFAFALAGTPVALRLAAGRGGLPSVALDAAADALAGPRRVTRDLLRRRRLCGRRGPGPRLAPWLAWIAPVGLTGVFAALLAQANPLIAGWIAALPVPTLADLLGGLPRLLFWFAVLVKLWPLFRARRAKLRLPFPRAIEERSDARELGRIMDLLLSPAATTRVLLLLVALLALQIGLDGAYLWGGLALPDRMTYSAYAHRGAYPLVATALLAGGVALAIGRHGAPPPPRLAAVLLLVFLGENVVLVVSAMQRLSLYVAACSLTEWRVAAFAWMGLVVFGLGSIALASAFGLSARSLLRANGLAALAVLYGWCFLDVPRLVADYDVAHCAELRGEGPALDVDAVVALGPEAIPALDRYLMGSRPEVQRIAATCWRGHLARDARAAVSDWRSWSLAGWRLARYLDTSGVAEPGNAPAGDEGA